jgi:hypothetical protein
MAQSSQPPAKKPLPPWLASRMQVVSAFLSLSINRFVLHCFFFSLLHTPSLYKDLNY